MDAIVKKILYLLQHDAEITNKRIGIEVGLSTSAVQLRRQGLEREGVIKRYMAVLDKKSLDRNFVVFCQVTLARHKKEYIESFERIITSFKEVVGCYHTSGDHDYILKILVKDMEAYHHFLVNKLTAIEHIGDTHSAFVINELKEALEIPIDKD